MNLQEYLKSPAKDYQTGLQLYKKYRKDSSKDAFFNSVQTSKPGNLHYNLLIDQLHKISLSLPPEVKAAPETASAKTFRSPIKADQAPGQKSRFYNSDLLDVKQLPEESQKLYFRNQEITKKMARLHVELQDAKTDEERKILAAALDSLNTEREKNWSIIKKKNPETASSAKAEEQTATEPPTHDESETQATAITPAEMLKTQRQIDNIKINISRNEKDIDSGRFNHLKVKEKKSKIKAWKEELTRLQKIVESVAE